MWYLYIILAIIAIYTLLRLFIKIKFNFWSLQPVFHIYDLLYWIKPPGVILQQLPSLNRYVNFNDITTCDIDSLDEKDIDGVYDFINSYYLRTPDTEYTPKKENIMEYFKGGKHKSYISRYINNTSVYIDNKTNYKSIITARPLSICLKGNIVFTTYYVDNLCVHPGARKKGIAQETIQTQCYNLRHLNREINTCLFKREGSMTAIVPLTTYETYGFDVYNFGLKVKDGEKLPYKINEITEKTMYIFSHFIKTSLKKFVCVIAPEIPTIINLIKTKNIFIYGVIQNNTMISAYIFKNSSVTYDKTNIAIECIASISNTNNAIFVCGFDIAIGKCILETNATRLLIENTSHNNHIIEHLKATNTKIFTKSPTAFFLYNYACYSVLSNASFFLY
jgi:hypothetical protein